MSSKITIVTTVKNGSITRNRMRLKKVIESFEGKDIEISIKKKTKTRSVMQNAYYWGVIIPNFVNIFENTQGDYFSKEEVHHILKTKFNGKEIVNQDTGEFINVPQSTTENTTVEQEQYNEKCRRFAKEFFNWDIPLPNEQLTID